VINTKKATTTTAAAARPGVVFTDNNTIFVSNLQRTIDDQMLRKQFASVCQPYARQQPHID
jgi:hypothetical protein